MQYHVIDKGGVIKEMSTPLQINTDKLTALKEKANNLPSKLIIIDDITNDKYLFGISNGKLYYKLLTEEVTN